VAAESADQFEEVYSKHQIRYRLDCAIVHIKSEHEPCGVDCAIVATLCMRIMRTCACTGCVACAVVGAGARAGAVVGARAFAVAVAGLRARVRLLAPARSPTGDVAGHPVRGCGCWRPRVRLLAPRARAGAVVRVAGDGDGSPPVDFRRCSVASTAMGCTSFGNDVPRAS